MKSVQPFVVIHRKKTGGDYLIERYVEDASFAGTYVVWGDPMVLSPREMAESGMELVMDELREFSKRSPMRVVPKKGTSAKAFRAFQRSHHSVTVRLTSSGVEFRPKTSVVGKDEQYGGGIQLGLAEVSPSAFSDSLDEAMSLSS